MTDALKIFAGFVAIDDQLRALRERAEAAEARERSLLSRLEEAEQGSSNASRAAMGPQPHVATEAEPTAAEVELGARALFCHLEGWGFDQLYSDTVNWWFTHAQDADKELIDDLKAQAGAMISALSASTASHARVQLHRLDAPNTSSHPPIGLET